VCVCVCVGVEDVASCLFLYVWESAFRHFGWNLGSLPWQTSSKRMGMCANNLETALKNDKVD